MKISDILEHWATIYKPLSHRPQSTRLEDQSFFRIRYIDLENTFSRNANIIHSPCMLHSVTMSGELRKTLQAEVSHQVWFLSKIKDTSQALGRYDGIQLEQTAIALRDASVDFISWLIEVRRTGQCPVTHRSFRDDPQVCGELQSVDVESISFGVMPDLYLGQFMISGVDWKSLMPLYRFGCGSNGKYLVETPSPDPEPSNSKA